MPTPNVSVVDLNCVVSTATDAAAVNAAFQKASEGPLDGILELTREPLVSIDFNHNPASSTVAVDQTKVMDGTFVRVMSWYDNEWGFSNRMADVAVVMAKLI